MEAKTDDGRNSLQQMRNYSLRSSDKTLQSGARRGSVITSVSIKTKSRERDKLAIGRVHRIAKVHNVSKTITDKKKEKIEMVFILERSDRE